MRIAFDVSYIQKYRAGIGRHASQLIRALLAVDRRNEYVLHGWSFSLDFDDLMQFASGNVTFSLSRIPGDIKRLYWNRLRFPPIETLLGNIQVFHSTDPTLPYTSKARTVCTVHDLSYRRFPELFERRVLRWDRFVGRSIRTADAILVPSKATQEDVEEFFGVKSDRIHIVRIAVSKAFAPIPGPNDQHVCGKFGVRTPYALFVGTIEPRKNVETLAAAYELLFEQSHMELDLVLVGKKGWLYEEALRAIAAHKMRERIHYLEYVSDEDLAALYRQALFMVYPSLYEGYGFPVLEAMACGTPVITSNNSSMKEIAEDAAMIIDPRSPQQVADAMARLAQSEADRAEHRAKGLERVAQFQSESAARRVLDIYEGLS